MPTLNAPTTALLLIDVQERINGVMADPSHLPRQGVLLEAFTILDLPLVKNRYYTIKLTNEADPDGKEGAFRSAWVLSDDPKLDPKPSDPSLKGVVDPKYYDCVKTKANKGYWLIEPSGSGSKVTYYVYTDPGGAVPAWIANKANSIAAPKLAKAVRERAKLPQYAK